MDSIREIFDAISNRIRSPVFGSIAIMFLIINWKPTFYLLFSDVSARSKFIFFDANTTTTSLLAKPVLLGIAFAVVAPWIAYVSSRIAEHPIKLRKLRQITVANETLTAKLTLEQKRNELIEKTAATLTEAATKRDEEFQKIEDPKIKADLQTQIDELRSRKTETASANRKYSKDGVPSLGEIRRNMSQYFQRNTNGEIEPTEELLELFNLRHN